VELMPPYPNFGSPIPGHAVRIGPRSRKRPNCRDEVTAALENLIAEHGDRSFPRREIYQRMRKLGTTYAELTAYTTMQRMKRPDPRLPGTHLERTGRDGFRLVKSEQATGRVAPWLASPNRSTDRGRT
jgi:hypothetical protein